MNFEELRDKLETAGWVITAAGFAGFIVCIAAIIISSFLPIFGVKVGSDVTARGYMIQGIILSIMLVVIGRIFTTVFKTPEKEETTIE